MPMTTTTEWQRARNNLHARRATVLKLTAGASTWLLSDKELNLTDGTVHQLILGHTPFESGFNIFTSKTKLVDASFLLSNLRYKRDKTADGWIRLSDELTAIRGTTAEVYYLLGERMNSLSDGLLRFTGKVIEQPEYNADTLSVRIVNKGAVINAKLPQKSVNSAFPAAPISYRKHKMPIVIGEFSFDMKDFANNLGLARAVPVETVNDRKYVIADHVLHSMNKALFFNQSELPLPSQMYESTININDSGRGTATAISSARRWARAFLPVEGQDSGTYNTTIEGDTIPDIVNLENALDLDVSTFATFKDHMDITENNGNRIADGSAAIDGGGAPPKVQFNTQVAHGLSAGDVIDITGTTNYNGRWTINAIPTTTKIEILDDYVVENFGTPSNAPIKLVSFVGEGPLVFANYDSGGKADNKIGRQADSVNDVAKVTFLDAAAAVDKGAGKVGIPITGHTFLAGDRVTIAGTTNYNGAQTIDSVTANEVVITDTFVAETFSVTDTMELRIGYIQVHIYADKDTPTMDLGYNIVLYRATGNVPFALVNDYTLGAWNFTEFLAWGGTIDWANVIVWHLSTGDNDRPIMLGVKHESASGGDLTVGNQTVGRIHAAYLIVPYTPRYRGDHFAACKGATYGSWITGRSSAYASGDLIEDPAGIVEWLLRTQAGLVDADFDLASFVSGESSVKARLNLHNGNQQTLFNVIKTIAEQSTLVFTWGSDGKARCVDLANKTPTVDRVIPFSHIVNGRIVVGKTKVIRNELNIQSRWKEELGEFTDDNSDAPFKDLTSQGKAWGVLTYNAKWKQLAGTHVTTVANHKVNATDGIWSKEHPTIQFATIGRTHSDLVEGDWISIESVAADNQLMLDAATWAGKKFIINEIREIGNGTEFDAIGLWI